MLSKFKGFALAGAVCTLTLLCASVVTFSQAPQASVKFATEPPLNELLPFEAEATDILGSGQFRPPAKLKFQALDAQGVPLENAQFRLKILAPPPTPWFTTDFPAVEGSTLLDFGARVQPALPRLKQELPAVGSEEAPEVLPPGEFQVEQMLPIRGDYQLEVNVTPVDGTSFEPIAKTFTLTVPEDPLKYRYLLIVLGVLAATGFAGGWVIGQRQQVQSGEIAPQRVRLLLSGLTLVAIAVLLFINISAEFAEHHGATAASVNKTGVAQSQGLTLELTGDDHATVGQTASLQAKLTDSRTRQPIRDAIFTVKATQLENNWASFMYQGPPDAEGKLTWQQQFFDGAPHQVTVDVAPSGSGQQFSPFQVAKTIDVDGVKPSIGRRLVGLIYFTSAVVLGLLAGLWLQHQRMQRALHWNKAVSK